MPRSQLSGIILIASAVFLLSLSGVMVRSLTVDDWTIVFWRSAFMAPTMLVALAVMKRGRIIHAFKGAGMAGFYAGVVIGIALVFYIFSITRTTVANTLVLISSAPLFAAILGMVFLRERVRPTAWIAMAIAGAGITLMFFDRVGVGGMIGNLFAIGAAILYALNIVIVRAKPNANMIPVVFFAALTSMAITLPEANLFDVPTNELGILAAMGVFQIGLGLVLFMLGAQRLPPAETALIALIETILAPLWVWLVVAETPSNFALIGGSVVIGAVAAYSALTLRRQPSIG